MRILQVVPYFQSVYAFGGPAKVAYQISRELAKRGHEVVVYTSDAKDLNLRIGKDTIDELEGIKVYYFRNISMTLVKRLKLFITPQLASKIKKDIGNFDIVHLHEYRTFQNVIIHYYTKRHGVPYILQAHGSISRIGSWKKLKWICDVLFGRVLLRDASRVIALNSFEAEQYRTMGVPEEKIAIIPNGIDLSEYANLPPKGSFKTKYNIPEDKKLILYLGRIHKTKGIDLLIKAYAHLKKKMGFEDAVLVIAGPDDGYLTEARVLANSLDIADSVMFTGFISEEDKLKALVDAEVFVTPSFYGFPMTFLEACATRTPIITTNLGDTLEWIDGKAGYVTRPIPYDIAEAVYNIISDEALRGRFSENCTNIVRSNFSIENMVSKLEKVYKEVLESRTYDSSYVCQRDFLHIGVHYGEVIYQKGYLLNE
ncbi:MAG: glycosyltransferase [Thermoproteota archaeon]